VITSTYVLKSIISSFEKEGWIVHHRYDYNPALIRKLGFGDRRFVKSDDIQPVFLPEPNLTMMKGGVGVVCEIDYKYSKKSFVSIVLIKETKSKTTYLKKYFSGKVPKQILYGAAMPNLDLHVERGRAHLSEIDFFVSVGSGSQVFKIKSPRGYVGKPFSSLAKPKRKTIVQV
jgi:hypothetical protein